MDLRSCVLCGKPGGTLRRDPESISHFIHDKAPGSCIQAAIIRAERSIRRDLRGVSSDTQRKDLRRLELEDVFESLRISGRFGGLELQKAKDHLVEKGIL